MGGSHSHSHSHGRGADAGRLRLVLGLVVVYALAEVVGGFVTGSLALLADAAHMASDAAALGLALFALWFSGRPSTGRHTYGFHRSEILAALANGAALVAISLLVLGEAWERFRSPVEVSGAGMTAVAAGGLAINLLSLWLLHDRRHGSLNMSGAWLHVLSDTLGSVQAIAAGLLIEVFGWQWADPVASALISVLVIMSAWGLLRASVAVLMESAPAHLDVDELRDAILGVEGVRDIHDLHVWTITSGLHALSAHVAHAPETDPPELLSRIRSLLHDEFELDHLTIQLEPEGFVERGSC